MDIEVWEKPLKIYQPLIDSQIIFCRNDSLEMLLDGIAYGPNWPTYLGSSMMPVELVNMMTMDGRKD